MAKDGAECGNCATVNIVVNCAGGMNIEWGTQSLAFYSIKIQLETPKIQILSVALLSQASQVGGCMLTCTFYSQAS